MKEYASQVEMCKVGECLIDLYEGKDGQLAVVVVDPVTDSANHVVWVSEGLSTTISHCDGSRLVLGNRSLD